MSEFFSNNYGEIFALGASLMWAGASLVFTQASHALGSGNLNRLRLIFATAILAVIIWLTTGWSWTQSLTQEDIWLLAFSGVIGLSIGDRFYFAALKEMGPRLSTQVFALNPVSSILIAWWLLGERLSAGSLIGIFIAMSGVLIVTAEKGSGSQAIRATVKGVLAASVATVFHSIAFVVAKYVMVDRIDALHGSFVRMVAAMIALWIVTILSGKALSTFRSLNSPRRWALATAGSLLGPSLGVWVALIGINHAPVGVASTLLALTPLFVIPLVIKIHGERVSRRAILGATIAFAGVALIFAF